MLPQEFERRMQQMLGEEYSEFAASYDRERVQALRVNTLKADRQDFFDRAYFSLREVPWAENGFYYSSEDTPGKHPCHEAGVYYIQEPSAMAPAEYLQAQPGERILDLCAAPGGKSTQIAACMQGRGILVCNEIHPARAKILSENVERMGIKNAIVTNETPQRLAGHFVEYFDRILVDAPCSGEGMFRKNETACEEWSEENVHLCAERQAEILDCAASMLRPGGCLVYSTCTFAPEENEDSIGHFLEAHEEFEITEVEKAAGMSSGNPAWSHYPLAELSHTIRLFPHRLQGEGHYLAVLKKREDSTAKAYAKGGEEQGISPKSCREFLAFREETIRRDLPGIYLNFGDQLYLAPEGTPSLKGLKVLRPGLHLGTNKKNRFEPSHALALALSPEEVSHTWNLSSAEQEIRGYLNGLTIPASGEKGWYLITVDGYSIGWGKMAGSMLKNHYPKGLRKNYAR